MIDEYREMMLESGGKAEVNFDKESMNCKIVKFTKDNEVLFITKEELVKLAVLSIPPSPPPKYQRELSNSYHTVLEHQVKLGRDFHKGETIRAIGKYVINIPHHEIDLAGKPVPLKISAHTSRGQPVVLKGKKMEISIPYKDFETFIYLIGDDDDYDKLLTVVTTKIIKRQVRLVFESKVSRDYKKGETIILGAPYVIEPHIFDPTLKKTKLGRNK